jgi:Tfp pilus assembly protein PilO
MKNIFKYMDKVEIAIIAFVFVLVAIWVWYAVGTCKDLSAQKAEMVQSKTESKIKN